ncbi:hypothetical protein ACFFHM_17720 [Halalkalibacter kiskunsagensis]|uniref:Uncharacterized protein n=1 Tax=Halalkalibacter kiskunsagensis TaxID=1548599 RepID=A0ABV6KG43_9BACI
MTKKIVMYIIAALLFFGVIFSAIDDIKDVAANVYPSTIENVEKDKEKIIEQLQTLYDERTVVDVIIQDLETHSNLTDKQLELIKRAEHSLELMDRTLQQLFEEFNNTIQN